MKKPRLCWCGKEADQKWRRNYRCWDHRDELRALRDKEVAEWDAANKAQADATIAALKAAGLAIGSAVARYCPSMLTPLMGLTIKGKIGTYYGCPVVRSGGKMYNWDAGWVADNP